MTIIDPSALLHVGVNAEKVTLNGEEVVARFSRPMVEEDMAFRKVPTLLLSVEDIAEPLNAIVSRKDENFRVRTKKKVAEETMWLLRLSEI